MDNSHEASNAEVQTAGVESVVEEVHRPTARPKAPLKPFEQFSHETILEATQNGVSSDTDLSPEYLQKAWELLGAGGRQSWEAKYGRDTIAYQEALEQWEREHPNLNFSYNPEQGSNLNLDALRIEPDILAKAWDDFMETCWLSLFGLTPANDEPAASEDGQQEDVSKKGSHAKNILYRAELYRLRVEWSRRRRKMQARYLRTFEHNAQMQLVNHTSGEESQTPIFEVTTFLGAPAHEKKTGLARLFGRRSSSDDGLRPEPLSYDESQPIPVRAEAGTVLTINSPVVLEALHAVAPGYPDLAFEGDSLVVAEPFCVLLQFREEMLKYDGSQTHSTTESPTSGSPRIDELFPDSTQPSHIKELYSFLDHRYLDAMTAERLRWQNEQPVCTFEWSWLLFTPGTLVYEKGSSLDSLPSAFLVESFSLRGLFHYDRHSNKPNVNPSRLDTRRKVKFRHRLRKITIALTYLKHDGRKWIPGKKSVTILPFNGERLITNLPVYPAEYFDDSDGTVRTRLIERGQRYHKLASRGLFEYHGQTLSGTRRWLHSRIIVDSETYNYDEKLAKKATNVTEDYYYKRTVRERLRDDSPRPRLETNRAKWFSHYDSDDSMVYVRRRRDSYDDRESIRSRSDWATSDSDSSLDWDTKVANILGRRDAANFIDNTPLRKQPLTQLLRDQGSSDATITDEIYLICHYKVIAYVLEERDWVWLDVAKITDCAFQTDMIDDLQISDETKQLIQALSHTYMSRGSMTDSKEPLSDSPNPHQQHESWTADFVRNKGRGQVLLLHGKPGVGKTTAAECVAELTKRPLLSITCGDLGTKSSDVEAELTRWLRLGALWKGILLFDEADIFLETRVLADIERNSLVSVFLRALEYYQGLIFLTTNRVGTFDEAVISRVHVILHFPDLSDDDRVRIWDTSFRKLSNERPDLKVDFSALDFAYRDNMVRDVKWNGREIRNAFNTMVALAEWEAREKNKYTPNGQVELRREHLQQVTQLSKSFKEYMRSLRGVGEEDHAKMHGLRDDKFNKTGKSSGNAHV